MRLGEAHFRAKAILILLELIAGDESPAYLKDLCQDFEAHKAVSTGRKGAWIQDVLENKTE